MREEIFRVGNLAAGPGRHVALPDAIRSPPVQTAPTTPATTPAPSFWKPLVLALATVALSTWALGSLWLQSEGAALHAAER